MIKFVLQPELVHKLIIEDVAPSKIITHSKIAYPDYLRAMERVKFDHSLNSVMARNDAGKQLREAIPVSFELTVAFYPGK